MVLAHGVRRLSCVLLSYPCVLASDVQCVDYRSRRYFLEDFSNVHIKMRRRRQ